MDTLASQDQLQPRLKPALPPPPFFMPGYLRFGEQGFKIPWPGQSYSLESFRALGPSSIKRRQQRAIMKASPNTKYVLLLLLRLGSAIQYANFDSASASSVYSAASDFAFAASMATASGSGYWCSSGSHRAEQVDVAYCSASVRW